MGHIAFVTGLEDENWVRVRMHGNHVKQLKLSGACNVWRYFDCDGFSQESLLVNGVLGHQGYKVDKKPDVVFNEVSDVDSHGEALNGVEVCCDFLSRKFGCAVLNHPKFVRNTSRDKVADLLKGVDGVIMPQTIRFPLVEPEQVFSLARARGLSLPLLVRSVGSHNGKGMVFVKDEGDLDKLHGFAFDGRDFYLTEFVDFKSRDGFYRKFRFVVVGGVPFLRHVIIDRQWHVHGRDFMRDNSGLFEEEAELLRSFDSGLKQKVEPIVRAIYEKVQLDYFGIDCFITDDGKLLVFEVNASMNILRNNEPLPNCWAEVIDEIKDALAVLFVRLVGNAACRLVA